MLTGSGFVAKRISEQKLLFDISLLLFEAFLRQKLFLLREISFDFKFKKERVCMPPLSIRHTHSHRGPAAVGGRTK